MNYNDYKALVGKNWSNLGALLILSFLSVECCEFIKKSITTSWDCIREQRVPADLETPSEPLAVIEAAGKGK